MTNASPKIDCLKMKGCVFSKYHKCMTKIHFFHLNIIEEYNYTMNTVDIFDQLVGSYRFDHWVRKIKLRWLMFFGSFKCF